MLQSEEQRSNKRDEEQHEVFIIPAIIDKSISQNQRDVHRDSCARRKIMQFVFGFEEFSADLHEDELT